MWAEPRNESLNKTTKRVIEILGALKNYGSEIAPNYLTARRKYDAISFNLDEQSIHEILKQKIE